MVQYSTWVQDRMDYSKKKQKKTGVLKVHFFEKEWNLFFTLCLEIPDKTMLHPRNSAKLLATSFRYSKIKNQDLWKFHIFSLIPQEIPYPELSCLLLFWSSPIINRIIQ